MGFHSYNQWSDYIPQGTRKKIFSGGAGEGFGGGLAVWPYFHTHERGSLLGSPLLALARPGHSCKEQQMVSTPKTLLELNIPSPGNTNPLGYSREDDKFSYSNLENYTGNNSIFPDGISIGDPIEIDFTSKRVKPTIPESDNVFLDIDALGDEDNWEYVPAGVDPLLPTVLDPTGMVGAARSFFQLQAGRSRPHPNTNVWGVMNEQYNSFSEAGGITFPPLSVYRDVERNKLIQGQPYSFCVYLRGKAKGDESFQDNYATSAMVTIAPIGSNNSYTRLVLKLGEPAREPIYWEAGSHTSSILTNGHSYTGDDAASVEEIVVPWNNLYPNADKVSWYKVRVTIPYDAFEMNAGNATLGIDAVQNKGLRCFVQAYNDRFDGLLPEDIHAHSVMEREAILHTPCKLLTWGYGLYASTGAGDFRRYEHQRMFRLGQEQLHPTTTNNGANAATGEIANVISYDSSLENIFTTYENEEIFVGRQLYRDDNGGVYTYEKDLSGLKKLTLLKTNAPRSVFKSNLFKGISFYDNSGLEYSGPINFSIGKRILRPENYSQESEAERVLTLSGTLAGTNIGKYIKGSKPIEPVDLLHLFRYFNKLGKSATRKGFNTRVWSDSSAVHCASGGSRLSYRVHPDTVGIGEDGTYGNYTQLEVDN